MAAKVASAVVFAVLVLSALGEAVAEDFYRCLPGITDSPGVMLPRGDIHVEVGSSPFSVSCHLNPENKYYRDGHRSNRLGIYATDERNNQRQLKSRIVNSTTIEAVYNPADIAEEQVKCKIDLLEDGFKGICPKIIFVGVKPLLPEDFTCTSYNWQNLKCTWSEPANPVKTKYSLSYIERGLYGRQRHCPKFNSEGKLIPRETCFMDLRTNPPYRQASEKYQFLMNASNALDREGLHVALPIDHYSIVKPNPPEKLSLDVIDAHTLKLYYDIPHELSHFPPGLVSSIRYRSEFDMDGEWKQVDTATFPRNHTNFTVLLEDLTPYAEYTVQVRLRSAWANASDIRLWSEVSETRGRAQSALPRRPPRTFTGSFEVVNGLTDRAVYVYWQQIEPSERNGPDFGYTVTEVSEGGRTRPIHPSNVTGAYALFPRITLRQHKFFIASKNSLGTSEELSTVTVPHHDQMRGLQPRSFTKIAYSDQLFEVSWVEPVNHAAVVGYTVYWCKSLNHRDRPYQCQGYLEWVNVKPEQKTMNITLPTPDVYQFAVAANTREWSSGMVWATCTILHNKIVGKLKTVRVDVVQKDRMKVRWRLDCTDRVGIVTGYRIEYCAVDSEEDTADCVGPKGALDVGPAAEQVWLHKLSPWTYYKVGVSVLTRAGASELSDYLVNKTARDRPGSPPRFLRAEVEDRNRVKLAWQTPAIPNGPISSYEVKYEFKPVRDRQPQKSQKLYTAAVLTMEREGDDMFYEIGGLKFNADYIVRVRGCTTMPNVAEDICSYDWTETAVKTGIGKSDRMPNPMVTFKNSTAALVEWGHLFHLGGPLLRFDVNITHQRLGESHVIDAGRESSVEVAFDQIGQDLSWVPDCYNESVTNLYNFSVRAVTLDPASGIVYSGDWSRVEVTPAYCKAPTPWAAIIGVTISLAFLVIFGTIYSIKSGYGCSSWYKDAVDAAKRTELVVAHPNQIGTNDGYIGGGEKMVTFGNGRRKPPLVNVPADVIGGYHRTESKESTETLLSDPKRNASGNSESTSGCESARSSEIGNDDEEADEAMTLNVAAAAAPYSGTAAGYVVAHRTLHDRPDTHWSGAGTPVGLPPGYSRMSQALDLPSPYGMPTTQESRGYVAAFAAAPKRQPPPPPPHSQRGYVTFGSAQSGFPQSPDKLESFPPPSKGYITMAEASKMESLSPAASERLPEHDPSLSAFGYSKMGMGAAPVSSGYVAHDELLGKQQLSDCLRQTMSSPLSPNTSAPLPTSPTALSPSFHTACAVTTNMNEEEEDNDDDGIVEGEVTQQSDPILMSPKGLKVVEARQSPYTKVTTKSLLNSKSTMV